MTTTRMAAATRIRGRIGGEALKSKLWGKRRAMNSIIKNVNTCRKFFGKKRENTELIYVATSSRSEASISVIVQYQRRGQRPCHLLSHSDVYSGRGLGGPLCGIYVSPSGVPRTLPDMDTISPFSSWWYHVGSGKGGGHGLFGLLWSSEEVQV